MADQGHHGGAGHSASGESGDAGELPGGAPDVLGPQFSSLVFHELRTPLTSVKGYVDLILDGEVGDISDDQRHFLTVVKHNTDRLVALIGDLLDLTRIQTGRVELRNAAVDLVELIEAVVGSLRPHLEAKEHTVELRAPETVPPVWGDTDRLAQIVTNLLTHASAYSPPHATISVEISADAAPVTQGPILVHPAMPAPERFVRIDVHDDGLAVHPDQAVELFAPFSRTRHHAGHEMGGTGLELTVAQALVALHGGHTHAQSAPGQGCTVGVTLPVAD